MDKKTFKEFYNEMCKKEYEVMEQKGNEYAGEENRFKSMEMIAEEQGENPIKVLWIYAEKQRHAINSYIKNKRTFSDEDVIKRIGDLRNFLVMLAGMIKKYRKLKDTDKWKVN